MRLVPRQSMPFSPIVPTKYASRPVIVAAPPSPTAAMLDELAKLGELKAQGVIDDAEFATLKARVLADAETPALEPAD